MKLKTNLKTKILGVSIAFVIVGGSFAFVATAFMDTLAPAQAAEDSNKPKYSETRTAVYKDGTTFKYTVKKPLLSTEDVQLTYIGEGEPPKHFDAYVDHEQALLAAITTQNDVRSMLNNIHLGLNVVGIEGGGGYTALTKGDINQQAIWDGLLAKRRMDSKLYFRLAEVVDNPEVAKDFKNVAALADIANEKKDAQAVAYMHEIIHDLDKWVYENKRPSEEVSHFGATHAEDGDQVTEIEAYITERPTLPTYPVKKTIKFGASFALDEHAE